MTYIREGLSSDGYLGLRYGGLMFGRAYFRRGLLWKFYGTLTDEKRRQSKIPFHSISSRIELKVNISLWGRVWANRVTKCDYKYTYYHKRGLRL